MALSEAEKQANQQYVEAMERLFASSDMKILMDSVEGWKTAIATSWRGLRPDQLTFEQGRFEGLEQVTDHLNLVRGLQEQDVAHAVLDEYSDDV